MISLVVPTLMLVCVLVCGAVSLVIVRARCLRGMGQGPMSSLSRDTYPTARGAAGPARPHPASSHPTRHGGVPVRVDEHGAGPRSAAAAQASPSSSLINRLAAGAPRDGSSADGGGDSGEKHSFLQELTLPPQSVADALGTLLAWLLLLSPLLLLAVFFIGLSLPHSYDSPPASSLCRLV